MEKYNLKNPAVKRILQEVKEMQSNPSDDFMSLPLEENIFEWQFAIRGPSETEFEGGIYHGRIQLPAEYPFKPPSFMLLTPNGRFETQTKICLSISNHHPEHWQPSWSVRTALVALIAFMPTSPNGALGSLDYKKEERHLLAIKSREAAPRFGTPERQTLIDEIHAYMLSKAPPVPESLVKAPEEESVKEEEAEEVQGSSQVANSSETAAVEAANQSIDDEIVEERAQVQLEASVVDQSDAVSPPTVASLEPRPAPNRYPVQQPVPIRAAVVQKPADDRLFTWAAVGLTIAIVFLLLKKFLKASGHGAFLLDES
ncbi:hypothetical protein Droror1_Dr00001044 [Drosera rotundifolia]